MIDEKKIGKIATLYAKETWNHEEEQFAAMCAFKEGTLWAQQEFLKYLWHDVSEEPDVRHKTIICLYKDGVISQDYEVYAEATEHDDHVLVMGEFDWEYYAREAEIEKWAYKNDILPKEGGEQ